MYPLSLPAAVGLDLLLGDPRRLPHPVRWIGSLVSALERILFPVRRAARKEFLMGSFLCVVVIFVCAGICGFILISARKLSVAAGVAIEIIIGFYCLSARSLVEEAMSVHKMLRTHDVVGARKALSMIVGRDTVNLDEQGITRATVETIAESITDGIVSPLFYLALGGPIAAVAFKAVSTMDSMIGHKNDRYRHFGTFAARLDDVLNFIPARLTGFCLIPISSLILRKDWKNSLRITARDRLKHQSPNSAHSESAMAGALGIQLGGGAFYDGVFIARPVLGDNVRPVVSKNIIEASYIAITVSLLMGLISCGILIGITKVVHL